jgi:hypothetical protein
VSRYESEIKLGERYRDTATGFEGVAIALTFWQHGCGRATLKGINRNGEVIDYAFDAAELEVAKTGEAVFPMTIDCPCGIRLAEYTPPPDAPIAVRLGQCYMEADCPACGTHHRERIPAS